jgi:CDP-diacylglycerol--serine O-phosphatidyltransferase
VARAARSTRRLGLRPPLRRRVAGRASAMARAVRRFGDDSAHATHRHHVLGRAPGPAPQPSRGSRLRLGLRRVRRR